MKPVSGKGKTPHEIAGWWEIIYVRLLVGSLRINSYKTNTKLNLDPAHSTEPMQYFRVVNSYMGRGAIYIHIYSEI